MVVVPSPGLCGSRKLAAPRYRRISATGNRVTFVMCGGNVRAAVSEPGAPPSRTPKKMARRRGVSQIHQADSRLRKTALRRRWGSSHDVGVAEGGLLHEHIGGRVGNAQFLSGTGLDAAVAGRGTAGRSHADDC